MSKNTKSSVSVKSITVEGLVADHEATPGAKRRSLRDSWSRSAMEAIMRGDEGTAKIYAEAVNVASQSRTTGHATVEVDWRQVTVDRIAALRAAADMLESGEVRPSGTPSDVNLDDLDLDAGTHHDVTEAARSLAATRLAGKRDVPEFIAERVAALGDGWHTASDLARGQVDAPGTGAIGAVYAKMTDERAFEIEGVIAGRNEKGSAAFHAA